MKRPLLLMSTLAGLVWGVAGVACIVISGRIVETEDAFCVTFGSRTFRLPESGLLGDRNTHVAEWGFLGLFSVVGAFSLISAPRIYETFFRRVGWTAFALSLAMAVVFASRCL